MSHVLDGRRAGVLCHVRSLPRSGVERFLDFLEAARIGLWQVLPLNPPDRYGSPYSSSSLFAIDPELVDIRESADGVSGATPAWLLDFGRFVAARERLGGPWTRWPTPLRQRRGPALAELDATTRRLRGRIEAAQRQVARAWMRLKQAANDRGVLVMGDMPLYPAHDSADVWAHSELFELDADGAPLELAGVPPDYFSASGQHWGNPVYRWPVHEASGFAWWRQRLDRQLDWFDVLRIDHFRGLEAFWAIPPDSPAAAGRWRAAPGGKLLDSLQPPVRDRLVAEDLGVITPAVEALRDRFALPGMRVLQFAFDGAEDNPHLPANCPENAIMYTGTHDNDTSLGWFRSLGPAEQRRVGSAVGGGRADWPWPLIEAVLGSRARTAIVPLQDLLGLGSRHRMNTPGTVTGNWRWQVDSDQLTAGLAARIRGLVMASGRS